MPVTKITLSTAMRARDVSRPHEEHLAEAAEREETAAHHPAPPTPRPVPPAAKPVPAPPQGSLPLEPPPARRRRHRS